MSRPQDSLERLCELLRAHGVTSLIALPIMAAMARSVQWMTAREIAAGARVSVAQVICTMSALYDRPHDWALVKREHPGTVIEPDVERYQLSAEGRVAMELLDGQVGDAYAVARETILAAVPGGLGGPAGEVIDSTSAGAAADATTNAGGDQ